jgi:hypothetical protein
MMLKFLMLGLLISISAYSSALLKTESSAASSKDDDETKLRKMAAPLIMSERDAEHILFELRQIPEDERESLVKLITERSE